MTPAAVNVVALRDDVVAVGTRRALTFLGVLGVLVWIIACANVGALLLSRTTGRSPELAIRLALGATRWRILRLTAAESLVIATTGTAAGTFVGLLTLRLLLAFGPPAFARPDLIRMDSTALLAGVALAALTTILVGAVAALVAGKGLESALRGPRKAGPAPRMVRLQDAIRLLPPSVPTFLCSQTLMRGVADATAESRYRAGLVTGFGLIAVLLTTAGLYALLAGRVVQRRRELAIRVAIGADPRCLVAMVLRQAARLLVPASGIGAMAAVGSVRLLSSHLFGISPWDAASFASAALGLLAAGLAAAYVPARQAARIDPIAALRAE